VKNGNSYISIVGQNEKHCRVKTDGLCFIPKFNQKPLFHSHCLEKMFEPSTTAGILIKSCLFACRKSIHSETIITQISANQFAIINKGEELNIHCKNTSTTINIPIFTGEGAYEVTIPYGCSLLGTKTYISTLYPSEHGKEVKVHRIRPAIWTKIKTSIINDLSLFVNNSEIINHRWHLEMPHLNLSATKIHQDNMEVLNSYSPEIHRIATQLSFTSTIWMLILTIWLLAISWKMGILNPFSVLLTYPVRANGNTVEVILESIENSLLLEITILLIMVIMLLRAFH